MEEDLLEFRRLLMTPEPDHLYKEKAYNLTYLLFEFDNEITFLYNKYGEDILEELLDEAVEYRCILGEAMENFKYRN